MIYYNIVNANNINCDWNKWKVTEKFPKINILTVLLVWGYVH